MVNYGNTDTLKKEVDEGFRRFDYNIDVDINKLINDQSQYISSLETDLEETKTELRLAQDKVTASLRRIEFLKERR